MFERLSEGINNAFRKISGQGRISEANVREVVDEVRTALLEADVDYDLVDEFCTQVVADARGQEVTKSLKPAQEFIWIVQQRLQRMMEPEEGQEVGVPSISPPPTIVMMCGLQGSGKTTTCGKLAAYLKKQGRSVMLAAADLQRPAAVEQLETVCASVNEKHPGGASVLFYGEPDKCAEYGKAVGVAVDVCKRAVARARKEKVDTVILDTAGRLHIDDDLMGELGSIRRKIMPHQTYLVVDAMVGQDAVRSAKAFHEQLSVDGVILTKFDSDTRGGAALSVRRVTGAPLRFVGTGEGIDAFEEFHADRIAGRILGMGDVVSLVEKAQHEVSEEEAQSLQEKMMRGELSMDDFLKQLKSIRRMGPMKQLLGMLPGVGSMLKDAEIDDKQLDRVEAMINSMTKAEREDVSVFSGSRRNRVAKGSGTTIQDVGRLTKQFEQVSKMAKQMAGMGMMDKAKAARQMAQMQSGGAAGMRMKGSTRTESPKQKYKKRRR
jgi:signal recognition particle subunit SRP54